MSKKQKVKAKGIVEVSEAIDYLRRLVSLADKGKVAVISDGHGLELSLPKYVKLEVEAEEKGGKQELSIELSWSESLQEAHAIDLRIGSSTEPEVRECLRTEFTAQEPPPCAEL